MRIRSPLVRRRQTGPRPPRGTLRLGGGLHPGGIIRPGCGLHPGGGLHLGPRVLDPLLAAGLLTVAVLLGRESAGQGWPALGPFGYALLALATVPAAFRSRTPVVSCLVIHSGWLAYITAGYWPVAASTAPMLAVYTVASLRPARTSVSCAVLMAAVWICAGLLTVHSSMSSVLAQALVWPAVLWRFGFTARRSAELARRLRLEQKERARREVAAERGRIARELHDVVAHHMSVISVQSGLARFVLDSDPPTARAALATISGTSTEALEEMRRMLRLLRADDDGSGADGSAGSAPDAPMPGLARLSEMVERVRSGGIPVELQVTGIARPLAPGVELCAYRVVQEALTNVVKHAPGAPTLVQLRYETHEVTVAVTNEAPRAKPATTPVTGPAGKPLPMPSPGGHGLIGMRERAKLYGGTISIGPLGDGYEVRLALPTSPRAVRREDDATS
jgi:signal transduction histidine kinase